MEKFTGDLNKISNLANRPVENAEELKAEFDEAANEIKEYLNTIVEPAVTKIENDLPNKVDEEKIEELKDEINKELNEKLTSIDNAVNELAKIATQPEDFVFTVVTGEINHGHGGTKTDTKELTKEGYMPLMISGYKVSGTVTPQYTSAQPHLLSAYLNNRKVGSCKTNVKVLYANNDDWTYKTTYELEVMWVKVKS